MRQEAEMDEDEKEKIYRDGSIRERKPFNET